MTKMTILEQQKVSNKYKRIKFKKLIPAWLKRDFGIKFDAMVKNKILKINICQNKTLYLISVFKSNEKVNVKYFNTCNSEIVKSFETVNEAYDWIVKNLRKDNLFDIDELITQDIIS